MMNKQGIKPMIAVGYLLIAILTGGIIYNSLYQWRRLGQLEVKAKQTNSLRVNVHEVYIHFMELSLTGESVLDWDASDYDLYHTRRMALDSLLQAFERIYPSERMDSIRHLLEDKEKHLHHVMEILDLQERINKQIAQKIPFITRKSMQEPVKKRSGFLGLFGKKKPTTTTNLLRTFNRDIISKQQEEAHHLEEYADSLTQRNSLLNIQLKGLIRQMDTRIQNDLLLREQETAATREQSFFVMYSLIGTVLVLLILSYVIISLNVRRINTYKIKTRSLIDQLKNSVARNQELLAARQKIMFTITHELRTPLSAISGYAELITSETTPDELERYVQTIRQSSTRMVSQLTALLSFFRLDSGKEQVNPSPFRLRNITDALETEFIPQAEAKGLAMEVKSCDDAVVMGDKERIIQIGNNLLSNAIKFTARGRVSLKTTYIENLFVLTVSDTGAGMNEEQQKYIFDAFERLPNAATQDGFGLGLAIVQSLARLLGGSVGVESTIGKGSRFTVRLPLPPAEEIADKYSEIAIHPSGFYSVLVLDDDEVLLAMTRDMFARFDIPCDTCRNVRDLMEMIRVRHYDVLITDLKMPEINGYDVLELLRTSNVGNSRTIPVIVATASGSCQTDGLLKAGFAAHLSKPFSIAELIESTEGCLNKSLQTESDEPVDFSSLLAYGCNKGEMLDKLIRETEKDMLRIAEAERNNDKKALDEWVHHLSCSWTLIRADKPLRALHERIHDTDTSADSLQQAVKSVLEKGQKIILKAKEEMETYGKDNSN